MDQYHFSWDPLTEKAPRILWSEYDVVCAEFMKFMQVPMEIKFVMKTHPFFKLNCDMDDYHGDAAVTEEPKE